MGDICDLIKGFRSKAFIPGNVNREDHSTIFDALFGEAGCYTSMDHLDVIDFLTLFNCWCEERGTGRSQVRVVLLSLSTGKCEKNIGWKTLYSMLGHTVRDISILNF